MNKVLITGEDLTLDEIVSVCRGNAQVEISQEAREKVQASRQVVDDLIAEEKVVYGITTGFGKSATRGDFPGPVQRAAEKPDYHPRGRSRRSILQRHCQRHYAAAHQ